MGLFDTRHDTCNTFSRRQFQNQIIIFFIRVDDSTDSICQSPTGCNEAVMSCNGKSIVGIGIINEKCHRYERTTYRCHQCMLSLGAKNRYRQRYRATGKGAGAEGGEGAEGASESAEEGAGKGNSGREDEVAQKEAITRKRSHRGAYV